MLIDGCAMLPIGAYEPEWFLRTQHVDPEDAVRAFALLGARTFVAMHHGTFRLTDEPMDEPLAAAAPRSRPRTGSRGCGPSTSARRDRCVRRASRRVAGSRGSPTGVADHATRILPPQW